MNRRQFLKRNGLWITGALAFPAIVRSQVLPSARHIAAPTPTASSGFNPTSWAMWIEADKAYTDAGTTPCSADNDPVQQMSDQSGHSINAVQTTLANKPAWKKDYFAAGKPAVFFNGTSNFFTFTPSASTQPFSMLLAVNFTNAHDASDIFVNGSSSRRIDRTYLYFGNPLGASLDALTAVYVYTASGASSVVYKNGSSFATGDAGATGLSSTSGWFFSTNGGGWATGYLAAWGIYSGTLSSSDRALAENYAKGLCNL